MRARALIAFVSQTGMKNHAFITSPVTRTGSSLPRGQVFCSLKKNQRKKEKKRSRSIDILFMGREIGLLRFRFFPSNPCPASRSLSRDRPANIAASCKISRQWGSLVLQGNRVSYFWYIFYAFGLPFMLCDREEIYSNIASYFFRNFYRQNDPFYSFTPLSKYITWHV